MIAICPQPIFLSPRLKKENRISFHVKTLNLFAKTDEQLWNMSSCVWISNFPLIDLKYFYFFISQNYCHKSHKKFKIRSLPTSNRSVLDKNRSLPTSNRSVLDKNRSLPTSNHSVETVQRSVPRSKCFVLI